LRTDFAEVLARETASLGAVTNSAGLHRWRQQVVDELLAPQSAYVVALRQTGDPAERARFVERWRQLIAQAIDRVLGDRADGDTDHLTGRPVTGESDAQRIAVLVLAALHGGGTWSRVTRDPRPLNAALDLAFARVAPPIDDNGPRTTDQ
jgi:hypothetical protein